MNRPFDDQSQARIRLETEAKLFLQQYVREGRLALAWSYVLDYENSINPFVDRRESIGSWRSMAQIRVTETQDIIAKGKELVLLGIKPFDALHVASALAAGVNIFVSTDDSLLRKLSNISEIQAMLPGDALAQVENEHED